MDNFHELTDAFFTHVGNTGSMNNSTLMSLMTLSLIDEYFYEMIDCNPLFKKDLISLIYRLVDQLGCVSTGFQMDLNMLSYKPKTPGDFNNDFNNNFNI